MTRTETTKTNPYFLRALVVLVALAAAVNTLGQEAGAAKAAFPGTNGKILFQSNRDGNEEIYSMNPDGSDQTNLTKNPANDLDPAVSPDGAKIAFASTRDGDNAEVYRMNALDGSSQTGNPGGSTRRCGGAGQREDV